MIVTHTQVKWELKLRAKTNFCIGSKVYLG